MTKTGITSEALLICEVVGTEYSYLPLCKSLSSLNLPLRNAKSAKNEAKECQECQEASGPLALVLGDVYLMALGVSFIFYFLTFLTFFLLFHFYIFYTYNFSIFSIYFYLKGNLTQNEMQKKKKKKKKKAWNLQKFYKIIV